MISQDRLDANPQIYRTLAGISRTRFEALYAKVRIAHGRAESKRLSSRERLRSIGAGRKFVLPLRDRLFMILMYRRTNPTYHAMAETFGINKSNVLRNMRNLEPTVKRCGGLPPARRHKGRKLSTADDIGAAFPDFGILMGAPGRDGAPARGGRAATPRRKAAHIPRTDAPPEPGGRAATPRRKAAHIPRTDAPPEPGGRAATPRRKAAHIPRTDAPPEPGGRAATPRRKAAHAR